MTVRTWTRRSTKLIRKINTYIVTWHACSNWLQRKRQSGLLDTWFHAMHRQEPQATGTYVMEGICMIQGRDNCNIISQFSGNQRNGNTCVVSRSEGFCFLGVKLGHFNYRCHFLHACRSFLRYEHHRLSAFLDARLAT